MGVFEVLVATIFNTIIRGPGLLMLKILGLKEKEDDPGGLGCLSLVLGFMFWAIIVGIISWIYSPSTQ